MSNQQNNDNNYYRIKNNSNQSGNIPNNNFSNLQKINSVRGIHQKSKSITYEFVIISLFFELFLILFYQIKSEFDSYDSSNQNKNLSNRNNESGLYNNSKIKENNKKNFNIYENNIRNELYINEFKNNRNKYEKFKLHLGIGIDFLQV